MKKAILVLSAVMLAFCIRAAAQDKQTEEYAIVEYQEYLKYKYVNVTIGDKRTQAAKSKIGDPDTPPGLVLALRELDALNKKGFVLLNVTSTHTVPSGSSATYGDPWFTWMMVRKIE